MLHSAHDQPNTKKRLTQSKRQCVTLLLASCSDHQGHVLVFHYICDEIQNQLGYFRHLREIAQDNVSTALFDSCKSHILLAALVLGLRV